MVSKIFRIAALAAIYVFGILFCFKACAQVEIDTGVEIGAGAPSYAVDVTSPPYDAACDGSTDDTAAIQACLDANAACFLPNSPDGGTQCQIVAGLTMVSSNNHFGFNALYCNGQSLGFTGAGTMITATSELPAVIRDCQVDSSTDTNPSYVLFDVSFATRLSNIIDHMGGNPTTSVIVEELGTVVDGYFGDGLIVANGGQLININNPAIHVSGSVEIDASPFFAGEFGGNTVAAGSNLVVNGGGFTGAGGGSTPALSIADGATVTFNGTDLNGDGSPALALSSDSGNVNVNGSITIHSGNTITGTATAGTLAVATGAAGTNPFTFNFGPAMAPTGSCTTTGATVYSQDAHATFCKAGTWTTLY